MKIRKAPKFLPTWITMGAAYFIIFVPQSVKDSPWSAVFVDVEMVLFIWMFASYYAPAGSKYIGSGKTRRQKRVERQHRRIQELERELGIEPSSKPIDFSALSDEQVKKMHSEWKEG